MKYYVVADVHSYYDELITALKNNGFFEENVPYTLIVCFSNVKQSAKRFCLSKDFRRKGNLKLHPYATLFKYF